MSIIVFHKLILSFLMVVARHAYGPQNNKFAASLQYLKKNRVMKSMLCMLINIKAFCKLIVLFLMRLARHVQSTRVNFQCHCNISRKKSGMKLVTLLHWLIQILLLQLLYIQCSCTIDTFPLSIWNTYQFFSSFDCLCWLSLFQVTVSFLFLHCQDFIYFN